MAPVASRSLLLSCPASVAARRSASRNVAPLCAFVIALVMLARAPAPVSAAPQLSGETLHALKGLASLFPGAPALRSVDQGTSFLRTDLTKMSCPECEFIVSVAMEVAANKTDLQHITDFLDAKCATSFPGSANATIRAICDDLAKDLVGLLPFALKQVKTVAWQMPVTFCSVIIPVCKTACCNPSMPAQPEQIHLSLTGDLTEMAVTWTNRQSQDSVVNWSEEPSPATWSTASGAARTYTAGGWIGMIHTATMTGLRPGTTYYYRVGGVEGWSPTFKFTTFPSNIGSDARPLVIAQIGDTGYGPSSDETIATLTADAKAGKFDVLMHVGDVGYADADMTHWDLWLNKVQPVVSSIPYVVAPGNHELWFNFEAYKARFGYLTKPMYYSLEIGPLHLTMVNTETAIDTADIDPAQVKWLTSDFAAANAHRDTTPWIIAAGHRPLYCSNKAFADCELFAAILRGQVEDLYYNSHVDLVIQCHRHDMERTFPTYKSKATAMNYTSPAAPTYVVSGAGGNREGNSGFPSDQPDFYGFSSKAVGFGRITIRGSQSMTWEFVAANSTVLDSFEITK